MAEVAGLDNSAPMEHNQKQQLGSHKLWLALLFVGALAAALFLGIYLGRISFAPKLSLPPTTVSPTLIPIQAITPIANPPR